MRKYFYYIFFVLCFVVFISSQALPKTNETKITINFVDVDLPTVVKFISKITEKNFIFDEKLKGKITIVAPTKLSVDEAYNLFTSVLKLKGFTVIPSGKFYKIIPTRGIREAGLKVAEEKPKIVNDAYIAQLIELKFISSRDALNIASPFISKDGYIASFGKQNMLLIVDSAINIERTISLLKSIDKKGVEEPEVVLLKFADAKKAAKILTTYLTSYKKNGTRANLHGRRTPSAIIEGGGKVIADERLNALILLASKRDKDMMKRIIALIDIPVPEEKSKINVCFLKYADAEELSKVLQGMISGISRGRKIPSEMAGKVTVVPDKATNALVIIALPEDYRSLASVIEKLDRKRKQVFVEAMIAEVSIGKLREVGAKWRVAVKRHGEPVFIQGFGTMSPGNILSIVQGLTGFSAGGMGNFMDVKVTTKDLTTKTLTVPGYAALFSLEEFRDAINILSTPQILTSDNQEAEIMVGENVPFISRREAEAARPEAVFTSIERKDVGITLKIKPHITEGDYVKLDVLQEITSLKTEPQSVVTSVGPTTIKRSTKTSVVVKDKQTVVIGGLMQEKREENITKVPLLGDIPILSLLFRYKSTSKKKTNLLVFLTPHVVRDAKQLREITKQKRREFSGTQNIKLEKDKFQEKNTKEKTVKPMKPSGVKKIKNIKSPVLEKKKVESEIVTPKEVKTLPEENYAIQVVSCLKKENAEKMLNNLKKKGYETILKKVKIKNKEYSRVYIVKITSLKDAKQIAEEMKQKYHLPSNPIVIKE